MNRRTFLEGLAAMPALNAQTAPIPIVDTHIHLFDPNRKGGVPWPPKENTTLYKPALPDRYKKIAAPLGVVAAIEVECSALLEDNQWVLDTMADSPMMVGTVGDLEPGKPGFRKQLDRFHKNPLFLGIRYGNLWGRDLASEVSKPAFIDDVKALADAGLELDTANQTPSLLAATVKLTDRVPKLRVVIDHLPQMDPKGAGDPLRELGKRPQVYAKVSEVLRRVDGQVPGSLSFYKPRIDAMWDLFGEDRLLFGSDWPNSDTWASYPELLKLVREYFDAKGKAAAEKFFWKNSIAAYRWKKRDASQPGA